MKVIAVKPHKLDRNCSVVLRHNDSDPYTPYVTHITDGTYYFWGHYFKTLDQALSDWESRS